MHLKECLAAHGENTEQLDGYIDRGRVIYTHLLDACHTGHTPTMPSSRDLGAWEAGALRFCRQLAQVDHPWFRTWEGPSDKGPLQQAPQSHSTSTEYASLIKPYPLIWFENHGSSEEAADRFESLTHFAADAAQGYRESLELLGGFWKQRGTIETRECGIRNVVPEEAAFMAVEEQHASLDYLRAANEFSDDEWLLFSWCLIQPWFTYVFTEYVVALPPDGQVVSVPHPAIRAMAYADLSLRIVRGEAYSEELHGAAMLLSVTRGEQWEPPPFQL
jgi:hypothetical protein